MAKERRDRYQKVSELRDDLKAVLREISPGHKIACHFPIEAKDLPARVEVEDIVAVEEGEAPAVVTSRDGSPPSS